MAVYHMTDGEMQLADIIWEEEPVPERAIGPSMYAAAWVEKINDIHRAAQNLREWYFSEPKHYRHIQDEQRRIYPQKGRSLSR